MFGSFGWMELLLILFIVLIIFGAGKIPQLGEGLGKAIKGFKKSIHEVDAIDVTSAQDQPPPPSQATEAPPSQSVPDQPTEAPAAQAQVATPQPEQTKQG